MIWSPVQGFGSSFMEAQRICLVADLPVRKLYDLAYGSLCLWALTWFFVSLSFKIFLVSQYFDSTTRCLGVVTVEWD